MSHYKIHLIGCGMGDIDTLTVAAYKVIEKADVVLGPDRLTKIYQGRLDTQNIYLPEDVLPYFEALDKTLQTLSEKMAGLPGFEGGDRDFSVAILFSGDTGFFSGAKKLKDALNDAIEEGVLDAELNVIPGISSVSYLASRLGIQWNDAGILSVHGRGSVADNKEEILDSLYKNDKTILLVSGAKDINELPLIFENENVNPKITLAFNMGSESEYIRTLTLEMCKEVSESGLYLVLLEK